ncbi:hypothetical protein Acr_06g0007330 [Actinidia rufa]|uniref:Integrase catalytic domain-containing protein n=1 Tax=Actinidia rufa TaxID=165716 RepID=A0A7J0EQT2_9ERIC|nr:hypothetical protein Acr_06g0007330 [Actinidia rufa]
MANLGQAPDLEGLHREIHDMDEQMRIMNENNGRLMQLLTAAKPPTSARGRRRASSPSLRERSSSSESSQTRARVRRGRSPHRGDQIEARNKSTSQKIRDLDARLDAINTGTNALVTVDTLVRQTDPPFTEITERGCSDEVMCRAFSATLKGPARNRQKNASYLFTVHQKETESLKDFVKRFNQAVLEVEDHSDKVSKVDKYIAAEELAEAKRRGYLRKYVAARPPPNSPERRYGDNRPTAGDIQTIHGGFGSGGYSTSSRKRHARSAHRPAEEEIYNLSSSLVADQTPITFSNDDLRGLHLPHDDALVVSAVIANFNVQRILIDNGSSADILFISAFERMKIGLDKLHPFHTPLIGFGGNTMHPLGWINLSITLGSEPHQTTVWQDFIVVDCPSPYNAILGRPTLGGIKAITSTYHLKLKFPTPTGIGEIKGDQKVARDEVEQLALADPRETNNTKPLEETVPISIHPEYPDRHIMIGTELTSELRFALIHFLKENSDVFAWSQRDVPGIDPEITMHKLFTDPQHSPVCQKRRKFTPERLKVIEGEVNKLIRANVLKEYLGSPPLLTVPTTGEDLYVYLSISPTVVSVVLILEEDQVQRPIYYVSKVLMGVEARPRMAIKAQALADFTVESTHDDTPQPETNPPETGIPKEPTSEKDLAHWILFVDGSSNQYGCGAGLVIQTPSGEQMEYAIRMGFKATNNEAEYEALFTGLRVAVELGAQSLEIFTSPSIGVADQILQKEENSTWMDEIIAYLQKGILPKDKLQARCLQYRSARFRIPKVIISDNARQFDNDKFRLFCSDLAISHHFSSPGHPQANGQVEVTNRTILKNLKARLERSKSEWAEDLPSVLWAYYTTSRIPTGETPYSMVFGTESVIPVEIGMPNFRTSNFNKESNEVELRLNLDLLEERREKAELRQAAYKCQVAKYYNQRVKHRSLLPGDLVLRRVTLSTKEPNAGKLGPMWEGPYKVVKVSRPGTY